MTRSKLYEWLDASLSSRCFRLIVVSPIDCTWNVVYIKIVKSTLVAIIVLQQSQLHSITFNIMHLTSTLTTAAILSASAYASPLQERQSCPGVHVFGARETTAPAGYGSAGTFVNLILNAYAGSTAEAINYPAQGDSAYGSSVQTGTKNIANQINAFNTKCPNSKLVVVGYSQGAQIGDNALCGGGDPNQGITYTNSLISASAANAIKAVIWAGNPRNSPAETFHYGSCTAGGVSIVRTSKMRELTS